MDKDKPPINWCWIFSIHRVLIPVGTDLPGARRHGAYWSGGGGQLEPVEPLEPLELGGGGKP